jgi:hypothetical protein
VIAFSVERFALKVESRAAIAVIASSAKVKTPYLVRLAGHFCSELRAGHGVFHGVRSATNR